MKKLIIAIVLAVLLVAGGLGGFVYAQEPVGEVSAAFVTNWSYSVPGDNFTNHQVTGNKGWLSRLSSVPWVGPSGPVIDATLSLDSNLAFDRVQPEPETMGPPIEWSFSNPEEGAFIWAVMVDLSEAAVVFIPGVDCSRSADQTVFSEEADQTLTIKVTPQGEEFKSFGIDIPVQEDDRVKAVPDISSVTGPGEAFWVETFMGEPMLMIVNDKGEIGTECTYTVTIKVTPKVSGEVEFMPEVIFTSFISTLLAKGTDVGTSVNCTMPEVGTWTWSAAQGTYTWHWTEGIVRSVTFPGHSREIVEPVPHEPMTGQKLVGLGACFKCPPEPDGTYETFNTLFWWTNPDSVSEITIERISIFGPGGTVVYDSAVDGWFDDQNWTEPMKPHEMGGMELNEYLPSSFETEGMVYTVEVFWTWTDKEGSPLIGWATLGHVKRGTDGHIIEQTSGFGMQMVNLEQKLEPKD